MPPAGGLRLLLVSLSWPGPPQMEARREFVAAFRMGFLLSFDWDMNIINAKFQRGHCSEISKIVSRTLKFLNHVEKEKRICSELSE